MLTIDTREAKLIDLIKADGNFKIPYEIKNLQIGDIILKPANNPTKSLIIERKCIPDLLSSIKDGRYKEQKLRLQAEVARNSETIICYLIEGSTQTDFRYPADRVVFNGAMVSSIFRDKIPLIRTGNLKETLEMICRLYDRMVKDIKDFFPPITNSINNSNTNLNTNTTTVPEGIDNDNTVEIQVQSQTQTVIGSGTYLDSIKKCKKENLNPKLWNQIALSSIPGVSTNIAQKITEVYPTIKQLIDAYDACDNVEARIKIISEIILTDNGKVKRRIGNVVAKRIMEYLYLDNIGNTE